MQLNETQKRLIQRVVKNLLRRAGKEDPLMRKTQDSFFDRVYYRPAMKWADVQGFMLPINANGTKVTS